MAKIICHKCDYPMRPLGNKMVCTNPECGRTVTNKRAYKRNGKGFANPHMKEVFK
jgi:exosome complex RNA-binding protein Csl4